MKLAKGTQEGLVGDWDKRRLCYKERVGKEDLCAQDSNLGLPLIAAPEPVARGVVGPPRSQRRRRERGDVTEDETSF